MNIQILSPKPLVLFLNKLQIVTININTDKSEKLYFYLQDKDKIETNIAQLNISKELSNHLFMWNLSKFLPGQYNLLVKIFYNMGLNSKIIY